MAAQCELLVARSTTGYVVRIQGNGTSSDSPALVEFVRSHLDRLPEICISVDLLGCDYLDSTFLGTMLTLHRTWGESRFEVVADEAASVRLLQATKLHTVLRLVPQAPRSSGAFRSLESKPLTGTELGRHVMEAHRVLSELPSEAAGAFERIATQIERELEREYDEGVSLDDTVIIRRRHPR